MELTNLPGPQHATCVIKEAYRFELKVKLSSGDKRRNVTEDVVASSPEELISSVAELISRFPEWRSWNLHHVRFYEVQDRIVEEAEYMDSGWVSVGDPDSQFLKLAKASPHYKPIPVEKPEFKGEIPSEKHDRFLLYQKLQEEFGTPDE